MTGGTTRILIVDDERETVNLLSAFFKLFGFETMGAMNGSAGLAAIAEHHPQIVILDLMLPDMDGYEICRQVRDQPETKDLPVIILSSRTAREDVKRAYAVGATRYFKKPVNLDLLLAEVRQLATTAVHTPPPQEVQEADAAD